MAWLKLSTLIVFVGTLIVAAQNIQAASTTNGQLLKFYPITKEQYRSIMKWANQRVAIPEARVMEGHRSLADWSNTLHSSWNNLFNYTKPDNEVIKGYPICVIKGDDSSVRRNRGARQYENDYSYAGLAPTVVYTGTPNYGRPDLDRPPYGGQPPHFGYTHENPPYDEEEPITTEPEGTENDENVPIVNCVVVINRKNKRPTRPPMTVPEPEEEYHKPPHVYHPYPYPPSYHYPYPAPGGHYPYPALPPYGYPHYHGHEQMPESKSNVLQSEPSQMDPATEVHYQQMLNEYYNHLYSLYMADASTYIAREGNDSVAPQYDDEEAYEQYEYDSGQILKDEDGFDE